MAGLCKSSPNHRPLSLINDLSDLSEAERGSLLERTLSEERNRPFDLSRGPLFRTALLKLSEEEYVLLLAMHHIITDGWSMGVFVHELRVIYEAYLNQRPLELPELQSSM